MYKAGVSGSGKLKSLAHTPSTHAWKKFKKLDRHARKKNSKNLTDTPGMEPLKRGFCVPSACQIAFGLPHKTSVSASLFTSLLLVFVLVFLFFLTSLCFNVPNSIYVLIFFSFLYLLLSFIYIYVPIPYTISFCVPGGGFIFFY